MVVRGYLAGHAWRTYREGGRLLCGAVLPDGLREGDRLPRPIVTPTTKAHEGHDEDISPEEAIAQGIVTREDWQQLEKYALALFERGSEMARARGLLLVDTKYEFGRDAQGRLILIDEVHTPDSSRYYLGEGYAERQIRGEPQKQLSKEFVREWLMAQGFQGKEGQAMPSMPSSFVTEVSRRYIELYELVTGDTFRPQSSFDPRPRIFAAVNGWLSANGITP
jgi:phosphoribosylaminoimidazole-succinocarboxamide synthase